MTLKITREQKYTGFYGFTYSAQEYRMLKKYDKEYCPCGCRLSNVYIFIVSELKSKKLLPDDFEILCCNCKKVKDDIGISRCPDCGSSLVYEIFKNLEMKDIWICTNIRNCGWREK